ncbi:uncharacterized protein RAG0_11891 [Rhynchosporium agropyri]|uniref:DUF8004 domain-containing protein n=1 Tax=Rhynchosporium agropyri TaxID=914238 RepID=A0A1E1L8U6_9HELO|nr:uncharacterized protein RAG0_11891 [Rhynchosporium agropyri]
MPRKSSRKLNVDLYPSHQNSRSFLSVPLLETVHENEPVALSSDMMALLSKPPQSRMQRLSMLLPSIVTSEAKNSEETETVLRKQNPSESPALEAPTRAPLSAPSYTTNSSSDEHPRPSPHTSTPRKLQKQSTTSLQPASARDASPSPHNLEGRRQRESSLLPPVDMNQPRSVSDPISSAPVSAPTSDGEIEKWKKRRSWLSAGGRSKSRSKHVSQDLEAERSRAWISAGGGRIDYNLNIILGGDKIPELWDDSREANMYVYLHPKSSGRGPQIKCHSLVVQLSQLLLDIIYDNSVPSASGSGRPRSPDFEGRDSLGIEDATRNLAVGGSGSSLNAMPQNPDNHPTSESDDSGGSLHSPTDVPRDLHLYFPTGILSSDSQLSEQDVQSLVDARNFFAFFNGQPLISTRTRPSYYYIFMNVASALEKFDFSSQDGTTFGEEADRAFAFYRHDLRLTDIRGSRAKTVEGLVLGERMKCPELYSETFAHAVGKYVSITSLGMPIFQELSPSTKLQLQQSYRDLVKQQNAASLRLTDFNYPSIFSGVANSTSSEESKLIRFKNWKMNFVSMRRQVLAFYKKRYGYWPPKAGGKDLIILQGGLNRLVLKQLYADLCALYDILVDRKAFTTRGVQASEDREDGLNVSPTTAALRKLLAEFDRSSPPVQPPIPYDTPKVPTILSIDPTYPALSPKDQHKLSTRNLKEYEMLLLLAKSHNDDALSKNEFLEMYMAFEEKEGRGKNALELEEQRYGHWIFLYALIQSLPMLVTDAPTLQYTDGVEYFLCQMPANPRPWLEDGAQANRSWYNVAGGGGIVSLPSHMVDFSVEAVYGRSHCWKLAEKLVGDDTEFLHDQSLNGSLMSPLHPPPKVGEGEVRPPSRGRQRGSSNASASNASLGGYIGLENSKVRHMSRQAQRQSIALGLERMVDPGPGHDGGFFEERPGTSGGSWSRPLSRADMNGSRRPSRADVGGSRPMSRGDFGGVGGSPALDDSRGTSPMRGTGRRAASRSGPSGELATAGQAQSGSTFDDILGSMNSAQQKVEKKKSIMGFF